MQLQVSAIAFDCKMSASTHECKVMQVQVSEHEYVSASAGECEFKCR